MFGQRSQKMLSKKDMKIIAHLRKDARMSLTTMSRKTSIPVSTIFDRLKACEEGVIQKHTSLLDFAKLGFDARANITLRVDKDKREDLKQFLMKNESVNSVYKINNGYDFLIEGVFRNIKDLEVFLELLEERFGVTEKQVYYIIEDVKRESFMSDAELLPLGTNP